MPLNPETVQAIQTEIRTFAADLNLSEEQKTQLKGALEGAREKIEGYRQSHPEMSRDEVKAKLKEARGPIRQRVQAFFTPEQLGKWDAEVAKAKSFLGYPSQ